MSEIYETKAITRREFLSYCGFFFVLPFIKPFSMQAFGFKDREPSSGKNESIAELDSILTNLNHSTMLSEDGSRLEIIISTNKEGLYDLQKGIKSQKSITFDERTYYLTNALLFDKSKRIQTANDPEVEIYVFYSEYPPDTDFYSITANDIRDRLKEGIKFVAGMDESLVKVHIESSKSRLPDIRFQIQISDTNQRQQQIADKLLNKLPITMPFDVNGENCVFQRGEVHIEPQHNPKLATEYNVVYSCP